MANPRIPYAMPAERPALCAPASGSIMVHVVVNVEHWCFDQAMPRTLLTPPHGRQSVPDIPNFSWVEYGMRCGLPRMIEALRSRGIPASTSFNASVIDAYPQAAEALLDAGWEFIGHGIHQRGMQDEQNEAQVIAGALDKIEAFTGTRPRGWLSPGLRETSETPELLKQAGIDHVFDWVLDDLPNWMSTRQGPLLSVPYNLELNDSVIYAVEKHASAEFFERLATTLALFERESQAQPRVLALGLHPHLMGVPHRFAYFERMLDLLQRSPQVCFMTGTQIADWYTAQVPADQLQAK